MVTARLGELESFHMQKKKPAVKKKPADPRSQAERFEQFAREHGATEDVLDKAMGEIAEAPRVAPKPKRD